MLLLGLIGVLLAGMISGSFTVPARRLRVMSWNGAWLIYCVVAMLLVPCLLGVIFAGSVFSSVFSQHLSLVGRVLLAGVMFGGGAFLFGVCVDKLGVALSNAILGGTVTLVGSLSPLWVGPAALTPRALVLLLIGLMVLTAAIAASCRASLLRDRATARDAAAVNASSSLAAALLAVFAGCLSSMMNTGFVHGQPLTGLAVAAGVKPVFSSLVVWIPLLAGALLVNVIATSVRMARAGEFALIARAPIGDWLRAVAMGVLWSSPIMIYGACSQILGDTGTVYGWALLNGSSILSGILWGVWLGEWKAASRRAWRWLWIGLWLILLALFVLSLRGN